MTQRFEQYPHAPGQESDEGAAAGTDDGGWSLVLIPGSLVDAQVRFIEAEEGAFSRAQAFAVLADIREGRGAAYDPELAMPLVLSVSETEVILVRKNEWGPDETLRIVAVQAR